MALDIYSVLYGLPRHSSPESELPMNGVYIFFEEGEITEWNGRSIPRIVRVGTHDVDGGFAERIRQHYRPNRKKSVFRRHVGAALLAQGNPDDTRLKDWVEKRGRFPDVEKTVSQRLHEKFTFSCLKVDSASDREEHEELLIAMLVEYRLAEPSPSWLGHYAVDAKIRRSGLWNIHHVSARPLGAQRLESLQQLFLRMGHSLPHLTIAPESL